jgi:hypothetical protein
VIDDRDWDIVWLGGDISQCERTECQRNFLIGIVFVRMFPLESIVASQRRLFVHKGTSRSIAAFAVFVLIAYFSLSAAAQAAPALRVASELSSLTHHTRHNIRGYFAASNSSSNSAMQKFTDFIPDNFPRKRPRPMTVFTAHGQQRR